MLYASADWIDWRKSLEAGMPDWPTPEKGFLLTTTDPDEIKAPGDGLYRFILSTSVVDADRDTIAVEGWILDRYLTNPTFLWAHDYRNPPIGAATKVYKTAQALIADDRFASPGVYPFADMVRGLVDDGLLRTVSVGFRPVTYVWNEERRGVDFQTQELLEHSLCPVPSNPEALLLSIKNHGHDASMLRDWLDQTAEALQGEPGLWLPRATVEGVYRAVRGPQVAVALPDPDPSVLSSTDLAQAFDAVLRASGGTTDPSASRLGQDWLTKSLGGKQGKVAALVAAIKQPMVDAEQCIMMLTEILGAVRDGTEDVLKGLSQTVMAGEALEDMLEALGGDGATGPEDMPMAEDEPALIPLVSESLGADQRLSILQRGLSPSDASKETAEMDTPWSAPSLSDFTGDAWSELAQDEQRHIAQHYAWAQSMPPSTFGGLKLPHHRPADGYIVWRGVTNAAARLPQASIPASDMAAVRAHLGRHYRAFNRTPPWDANSNAWDEYSRTLSTLMTLDLMSEDYLALVKRSQELHTLLFPVDNDPTVDVLPDDSHEKETVSDDDALVYLDLDTEDELLTLDASLFEAEIIEDEDTVILDGFTASDVAGVIREATQAALLPLTGRLPDY